MKKILCISLIAVALSLNFGCAPVAKQLGQQLSQNKQVRQFLAGLGTEAAKELIRIMSAPRPDASRNNAKSVAFTDDEWLVAIAPNGNDLTYYGVNLKTRDSLSLRGGSFSDSSQLKVYSWNNGDYRYQLSWKPSDSQVIRLQVFNGQEELLNRLLRQTSLSD
jgi:hypothetical protein